MGAYETAIKTRFPDAILEISHKGQRAVVYLSPCNPGGQIYQHKGGWTECGPGPAWASLWRKLFKAGLVPAPEGFYE